MKMNLFLFIIISLLLFTMCDEDKEVIQGFYISETQYKVIAFGKAPENVQNKVKARNMAKEAALIMAQQHIKEKFKLQNDSIMRSGIIKKVSFLNNHACRLVYIINTESIKEKP